jgi:hypothetical protein
MQYLKCNPILNSAKIISKVHHSCWLYTRNYSFPAVGKHIDCCSNYNIKETSKWIYQDDHVTLVHKYISYYYILWAILIHFITTIWIFNDEF